MRFSNLIPQPIGLCLVLSCLAARASSYFVIDYPTTGSQWSNGAANPVLWTKGLFDGIDAIDVEMARLADDGLIFVAKGVPSKNSKGLYVHLEDIPAGNDYFLLFVNSTHGGMYSTSNRFTILEKGATPTATDVPTSAPNVVATTVSVSGTPDPTKVFATTFAADANSASRYWSAGSGEAWSGLAVMAGCVVGAAWTLS